jgi:peptidoglycan/LPS O-acetylase OafA/YrhL
MKSATRIPELDGVRGIAVLMVVAYHAFLFSNNPPMGWVSGLSSYGFAGVHLFFVLSGFLITGILLSAKEHPHYFRNFYAKRALRIWPLYYLLLLLTFGLLPLLVLYAHLHMGKFDLIENRSKLVYVLFLQNLIYPGGLGVGMLGMTWSLAIEEQFYIVWPWIVLLCSRRTLAYILTAVLVFSPLVRLWAKLHGVSGDVIYFATWAQLDGLALGALISLYSRSGLFSLARTKWTAVAALAAGAPAWLWLQAGYSPALWPLLFSAIALTSAGVVTLAIWCCQTNSALGGPFRTKWLRYVGQISFCVYLVHQPIYVALSGKLAKEHIGTSHAAAGAIMVLGLVISLCVASLSWFLFESPILKLKGRLDRHSRATAPKESSLGIVPGKPTANPHQL